MKLIYLAACAAASLALAACDRPGAVADEARNGSALPNATSSSPSPSGGAPDAGTAPGNSVSTAAVSKIPAALQGRWGLSPADCTSTVGDAKGLLVVGGDELRFYESVARPAGSVQTSANSISGDFAFTGEGQNWTNHQTLELRDGQLVRTERNPVASFRYVRCE